ncbi:MULTISPECIES: YdcF family protein [Paenibacillus]|uniref:YdcF family protein n=1 Tax=Paenibacillus TaxID=44249 RepID=UPI0022B92D2F|nr:YdcF family protein [Paenibacillus caseinilyticus]MCZ8521473.1 YdcF family protein [Paenibacillus caseinilyticus]
MELRQGTAGSLRRSTSLKITGILKRIVRGCLLLLLAAALWAGWIQYRMEALPETGEESGQVGIVLGASLWGESPSPALKERLDRAVELYKAGRVPYLIVSGGYDVPASKLTEAEGMRNYLVSKGVPSRQIILENKARSTYENLLYSKRLMEERHWTSAVIITHRYHGVRAMDMARYLDYEEPAVSPMDSRVLMMSWHRGRETLALTKWQWDKIALLFGIQPKS